MRILLVHNFYRHAGGEDAVFSNECELLMAHGHDVQTFTLKNDVIQGPLGAFRTALRRTLSTSTISFRC